MSDWPTATTELLRVVNNSDNMNEASVRMARSESPGTRLLHSLVSRRLAL